MKRLLYGCIRTALQKALIFLTLQNPYIFINKFLLQKIYKKNISTFQVKLH